MAAARELATHVWPVFPVWNQGEDKTPVGSGWRQRASREVNGDPEWFRATGVGVLPARETFFVVDVDRKQGKRGAETLAAWEKEHGPLPKTWTVVTGTGGWHYYFKHPGFTVHGSRGAIGEGIDIIGENGSPWFAVAPPSLHPNGKLYAWADGLSPRDVDLAEAPAWLLEMVQRSSQPRLYSVSAAPEPRREYRRDRMQIIERARRYAAACPPAISGEHGHDTAWNAIINIIRGLDLSEDEGPEGLADWNARCVPPWNEKELRHKIHDAIHVATVPPRGYLLDAPRSARPARTNGVSSSPAQPGPSHEPGADDGDDAPAYIPTLADTLRGTWHTFSGPELETDPPPVKYVARPRIPEGKTVVLSAAGGTGKTTLIVELAYRRAVGELFLDGSELKAGESVILTGEDGIEDFWRKLHALRLARKDFDAKAAASKIHILDVTGVAGVELVRTEFGQHVVTAMPESLAEVIKAKAPRADLIVVETISRFGGGPETNESHAQMIKASDRICRLTGAATVLVGHVSQAAGRAGIADQYAARGGTALIDNARSGLVMSPLTQENAAKYAPGSHLTDEELERYVILTHPKSMGPKAPPVLLERCWNDAGAYFRMANIKYRTQQSDAQLYAQLRAVVGKYMASGQDCTARKLRGRYREFGLAENRMETLVDDAVSAGVLRQVKDRRLRGGGIPLVLGTKEQPEDQDDD